MEQARHVIWALQKFDVFGTCVVSSKDLATPHKTSRSFEREGTLLNTHRSSFQEMTIQLHHVGLDKVQALPKDVSWVADLHNGKSAEFDEFNSLKLQYISLRDLMVAPPSTKRSSSQVKELKWCDPSQVNFKDELLKQAARAYLQPTGKKTIPKSHFFESFWKSFAVKNKSLMEAAKECVWDCTKACAAFLRDQVLALIQNFKPRHLPFLRMTPQLSP
ncbi:hypothetical protein GOP47_0007736 [Adiantum capillus-veneris]|uniref:Uncharacterized protein n=1 Tax=Adiantum capillus-veneris TaxID=13818 RepID=A0A9D4V259_ADICA|nr:hypothetical protein GOP47_0007736 [Adiantum capillus-veneris]